MKSTKKIPAIYKILASKSDEEILTMYKEIKEKFNKSHDSIKEYVAIEYLPIRREAITRNLIGE